MTNKVKDQSKERWGMKSEGKWERKGRTMGFEGNIWRWEASEATDQYVNYFFCSIERMQ